MSPHHTTLVIARDKFHFDTIVFSLAGDQRLATKSTWRQVVEQANILGYNWDHITIINANEHHPIHDNYYFQAMARHVIAAGNWIEHETAPV